MSYKKRELALRTHGYYDLAKEVIKQWNTDGRPRGDLKQIEIWGDLIRAHESMMHGNHGIRHGGRK